MPWPFGIGGMGFFGSAAGAGVVKCGQEGRTRLNFFLMGHFGTPLGHLTFLTPNGAHRNGPLSAAVTTNAMSVEQSAGEVEASVISNPRPKVGGWSTRVARR